MLFPNASMSFAGLSAANPVNDYPHGWTEIYGDAGWGQIDVCTATNLEIADRTEGGEFSFDVIDEHMTYLWFRDRDSFRAAWRLARLICSQGLKMANIAPGKAFSLVEIEGRSSSGVIVQASSHHVAGIA